MAGLSDEEVGLAAPAPGGLSDADVGLEAHAPQPADSGFFQSIKDHVAPVLKAFGQGFEEGFGPERMGMSAADTKWLSQIGIYAPEGATSYSNPFHAMNELLGETIYRSGQIVFRGGSGVFRGAQAGSKEAMEQAGVPAGLARDIVAVPEAFFGSPHPTGIPKALPEVPRAISHDTPAFQNWFEGSRVVDEGGQPLTVFHGTSLKSTQRDFAFDKSKMGDATGAPSAKEAFFFTEDIDLAKSYADNKSAYEDIPLLRAVNRATAGYYEKANEALAQAFGASARSEGKIVTANLAAKEPLIVDLKGAEFREESFYDTLRRAKSEGYDSVKFENAIDPGFIDGLGDKPANIWAVFEPDQIRVQGLHQPNEITLRDLVNARQVGVIGPEKPPLAEGPPREAAARATTPPDDILRGPEVPSEKPPTGNTWEERFDKFVGKLNTPEDVQNLIRDAAKENDGFQEARQGSVPLGHVESLAEAAGVAVDTVDPAGVGRLMRNDAQVRIGMRTMLQTTENVKAAARDVKAEATPENLIKLQEAMMRRDLAVEQIVGLRAEWGRTGNVFQEFLRDVKDQESLNTFLKDKGRSPGDLVDIAKAIDQLDGTQAARVLSDMHSKRPGVFYWTWVNGLISGLLTHTKYVAANALYTASEHGVVTPIAAMIGKAKQAFGADVERVYFGETMAATYGMIAAVPHSFIATGKSIWEGKRAVLKSEIELHKEAVARGDKVPPIIDRAVNQLSGAGRPEFFGDNSNVWGRLTAGDIGGAAHDALGRVIGAPGDMAMGIHTFFKILGERAALEAEAYHGAAKEGLSPTEGDFWRRRSEISENPTSDMRERAIASAYKGTFMGELGPHGRAWQKFTKETPGLKWLFPFSHIPLNLVKAAYEATPLALLDSEMRASITGKNGGVAQDRAIARMVAGSAIMGYFVHQALNGRATGDYPHDPQERDSWKLQGKQPNSIMVGGYWVSFNKFGVAGNLANLGANIGYIIPGLTSGDDDAMTKATWHAASAAAHMVIDEVGFQSLSNLFQAMHDDKKGAAWAASTAASFLPFSSALGQTASGGVPFTGGYLGDPYMREAKTFVDGIKNKLPGLRETLLPKRDWLGQPLDNPQYGNIIRQRAVITDPVSLEMERLQIHPGLPQDRIGGVKLSPKLFDQYQAIAGAYTKTALESLVNAPNWTDAPTSARINMIHATIRSSRQTAEAMMQVQHPELIGLGMQQKVDFITGKSLTPRPKKTPEALAQ